MAHGHNSNEKVVYVGDSRVKKRSQTFIPQDYSAYPGKSEAFIPNFLLKEWMVGAVVLVGIMVLVMSHPSPLGYPADPTNGKFIPMPDWYFLFMYQLLKYPYTSDAFVVLGTLGVPGVAFGSLLLAPFLDVGKERRFYRRPVASALMFFSLITVVYLTIVSWSHYENEMKEKGLVPEHIEREELLKAGKAPKVTKPGGEEQLPAIVGQNEDGYKIIQKATCITCHGTDLKGGGGIPPLRGVGDKHSAEEILGIIKNGKGGMGAQYDANKAAPHNLTDDDFKTLAEWLAKQKKAE